MAKKKDPRQRLVRRLTINLTEPEYQALESLAKSWGKNSPRLYLQNWIRGDHLKYRLSTHDRENQVV